MTVLTETEILRSIVPKAKVNSITFENSTQGPGKLDIIINYSIFDVVGRDAIGQWFNNQDYEKYFLIKELFYWKYTRPDENGHRRTNFYPSRERSVTEVSEETAIDIESPDGSEVKMFNFTTTKTLDIENDTIFYMKFVAQTRYDVIALEQDLEIDLFRIFDNRNITLEDYDEDGRIDNLTNREEVIIINNGANSYPVQDFRIQDTSRNVLDTSGVVREYQQRFDNQVVTIERQREINNQYLSDLWVTRSSRNVARFLFVFDPNSYFMNNSPFKNFYRNMNVNEKRRVIRSLEVPSLKVLRKRVIKKKTDNGIEVLPYMDRETERVIVETTKRKSSSIFAQSTSGDGRIRQIDISSFGIFAESIGGFGIGATDILSSTEGRNVPSELYFLTGDDYQIASVGEGDYSYGISINIADNMRDFLIEKIKVLRNSIHSLEEIYETIYSSSDYDSRNDMYLSSSGPSEILGENIYSLLSPIILAYQNSLRLFGPERVQGSVVNNFLTSFDESYGHHPTPRSIKVLSDSIYVLMSSALASMGESETSAFKETFSSDGPTSSKNIPRDQNVVVRYYTRQENIFSSRVEKRCYFDYLSNFSEHVDINVLKEINTLSADQNVIGIRVIDGVNFNNRMETEIGRYFNTSSGNISRALDVGELAQSVSQSITSTGSEYLLPAGISTGQVDVGILESVSNLYTGDIFSDSPEHILLSSHNITVLNEPGDYKSYKTLLQEDAGLESFTQVRRSTPRTEENDPTTTEFADQEKEERIEKFIFNKVRTVMGIPDPNERERLFSNTNFTPEQEVNNYITERVVESRESFANAPNIVRAMARPDSAIVREDLLQGEATLYSQLLTKIEYLYGFKNDVISGSVLSPMWRPLTIDVYRENTNKNLLCRIKPASVSELGIRTANTGVPIYDSFFVIKPAGTFTIATPGLDEDLLGALTVDNNNALENTDIMLMHFRSLLEEQSSNLERVIQESLEYANQAQRAMNSYLQHKLIPEQNRTEFTETVIADQIYRYYNALSIADSHLQSTVEIINRMKEIKKEIASIAALNFGD